MHFWLSEQTSDEDSFSLKWSLEAPCVPFFFCTYSWFSFTLRKRLSLFISVWFCAGIAARETAQALKTLAQAARGVAASTTDPKASSAMLDSARDVMEGSTLLIKEAKQVLVSPGDAESQQRLAQVSLGGWRMFHECTLRWILGSAQTGRSNLLEKAINTQTCAKNILLLNERVRQFSCACKGTAVKCS